MEGNTGKIETLLARKTFAELSEKERMLVLEYISGEEEYDYLRRTLTRIKETFDADTEQVALPVDMKEHVLMRFGQNVPQKKGIWDSILTIFGQPVYRLSMGMVTVCILVGVTLFVWRPVTEQPLAENREFVPKQQMSVPVLEEERKVDSTPELQNSDGLVRREVLYDKVVVATPAEEESMMVAADFARNRPMEVRNDMDAVNDISEKSVLVPVVSAPPREASSREANVMKKEGGRAALAGYMADSILKESFPTWPGTEKMDDAYEQTKRMLSDFLGDALAKNKPLTIRIYVDENGKITRADISGTNNLEVRHALEEKIKQLPDFVFTTGQTKKLRQEYVFR